MGESLPNRLCGDLRTVVTVWDSKVVSFRGGHLGRVVCGSFRFKCNWCRRLFGNLHEGDECHVTITWYFTVELAMSSYLYK